MSKKQIGLLLAIPFILAVWGCQLKDQTDSKKEFTRVNANTSDRASTVLSLYAYGQAMIQSLDCKDPASWFYQGAMHNVPPKDEIRGPDQLCPEINTNDSLRAWHSCPHMLATDNQLNFLTWHRLYTYYYERNIRHYLKVGLPKKNMPGLPDHVANMFSIPYWDYTHQGKMPAAFRMETSSVVSSDKVTLPDNPLYQNSRSPSLMAGEPIDYASTDSIAVNVGPNNDDVENVCLRTMGEALNYDEFLALSDVSEFSRALEDRLHNVIHDYVGGAVLDSDKNTNIYNPIYQKDTLGFGMMGYIPSAAFDPIFFLHHANVDRMFYAWEERYGPITPEQMAQYGGDWEQQRQRYQFWDAATNSWVTYATQDEMLQAAHSIDYTYEKWPELNTEFDRNFPTSSQLLVSYTHTEDKGEMVTKADSTVTAPANRLDETEAEGLVVWSKDDSKAFTAPNNKRYVLDVDITFDKDLLQQLVAFTIPPTKDWTACNIDEQWVHGISAFFGSTHAHRKAGEMPMQEHKHSIRFDVTHAIQNLGDEDELVVHFAVLNGENGGDIFVRETRLTEQAFN